MACPETAVEVGGGRDHREFAGHVHTHPQGLQAQVVFQEQGEAGGLGAPVQGEQEEPGDEKQHWRGQKIPAVVKQGGGHAPGQREFDRGRNQQQRPEAEQFQGGGKLKPVIPAPANSVPTIMPPMRMAL